MNREILTTSDGIPTLHIPAWNESYHSKHGVLMEASHVFIQNGLLKTNKKQINILEIGFGTGFNALLTFFENQKLEKSINYFGIEKFPLQLHEIKQLNYSDYFSNSQLAKKVWFAMHTNDEKYFKEYHQNFNFKMLQVDFFDLKNMTLPPIDLVYFDAFGARVQPELWTESLFEIIYNKMNINSLLTTYSSKGSARRAMQAVGFEVQKLQGPNGKREMVNAFKI